MNNHSETFSRIFDKLREIGKEISPFEFNDKEDSQIVHGLMLLKFCEEQTNAVSVLVKLNLNFSILIIFRSIFEAFFNFNWIMQGKTKDEQLERLFQFEGQSYGKLEKELNQFNVEDNLPNSYPLSNEIDQYRKILDLIKVRRPELTITDGGKTKFKVLEKRSLIDRIDPDIRETYYAFYSFTSKIIHTDPCLRYFLLQVSSNTDITKRPLDLIVDESLEMIKFFIINVCDFLIQLLNEKAEINHSKLSLLRAELVNISSVKSHADSSAINLSH